MNYPKKMIIHNVADIDDEMALRMVLAVIKKGRTNKGCYKAHSKFADGYHVDCRQAKVSGADTFLITKDMDNGKDG